MTLNEAIAHAEWAANNCEGECAEEHRQLAEWLRELQTLRAAVFGLEMMRNQLKAENTRLLGELEAEHALAESLGHYHELRQAENAKLRDAIDYLYGFAKTLGIDEGDMRGFGIEVSDD